MGKAGKSSGTTRRIAGVDGCPAGWVVVYQDEFSQNSHQIAVCETIGELVQLVGTRSIVVIDMPIGLFDKPQPGGRECERLARQLIRPRHSSVFSAPSRASFTATTWDQARRFSLSKQGYSIMPKVRSVDEFMTPELQGRVMESHPELAFWALAGQAMRCNKNKAPGRQERLKVLSRAGAEITSCQQLRHAETVLKEDKSRFLRKNVGVDDIIDAYSMLMVAARVAVGTARRIPEDPPIDRRGLRMEMWY